MAAPEKIYIPRLEGNKTFVHEWSVTKFQKYFSREVSENVEYTRTDAFIEKACEYLNNTCRRFILTKKDIEDFKKYMKGE